MNSNYPPGFDERDLDIEEDLCQNCGEGYLEMNYWWRYNIRQEPSHLECSNCDFVEHIENICGYCDEGGGIHHEGCILNPNKHEEWKPEPHLAF